MLVNCESSLWDRMLPRVLIYYIDINTTNNLFIWNYTIIKYLETFVKKSIGNEHYIPRRGKVYTSYVIEIENLLMNKNVLRVCIT